MTVLSDCIVDGEDGKLDAVFDFTIELMWFDGVCEQSKVFDGHLHDDSIAMVSC